MEYAYGTSQSFPASYIEVSAIFEDKEKTLKKYSELCNHLDESYQKDGVDSINQQQLVYLKYQTRKGRFIVIDGTHRILFLYLKGVDYIKAAMSPADFLAFINRDKAVSLLKRLHKKKVTQLPCPILHPGFHRYPAINYRHCKSRAEHILKFFRQRSICRKSALDIGCNMGFLTRILARTGLTAVGIDSDRSAILDAKAIGELENVADIEYIIGDFLEHSFPTTFHFGILFAEFTAKLANTLTNANLWKKVDQVITEAVFVELGNDREKIKRLVFADTKFDRYTVLLVSVASFL